MALPDFTMRQLLEAGVHFGHQKHRWNPKMAPYLFGVRNNVHIIDLTHTVPLLHRALAVARETARTGGRILFVGTKAAAGKPLSEAAQSCAQYYVDYRWFGGTLTNWRTISNSISRLGRLEELLEEESASSLIKKERLKLTRERNKLHRALGGIKDMGDLPDLMFVIDTNKEFIAVREAQQLGIPVMAVLDSNSNPDNIDYPIPGNDDGARAILLYCKLVASAALDGLSENLELDSFAADGADAEGETTTDVLEAQMREAGGIAPAQEVGVTQEELPEGIGEPAAAPDPALRGSEADSQLPETRESTASTQEEGESQGTSPEGTGEPAPAQTPEQGPGPALQVSQTDSHLMETNPGDAEEAGKVSDPMSSPIDNPDSIPEQEDKS